MGYVNLFHPAPQKAFTFSLAPFPTTIPPIMNLLAIETSGPILSVAVRKGNNKIREATLKGYFRHAESLLPIIDRLLKKENLGIRKIDAFLIDRGPGSFTGLRIAFATLKGLIASLQKPCYGALSIDLIAGRIPSSNSGALHLLLDAKRGKLYTRFYRSYKKRWAPRYKIAVRSLEEILGEIPEGSLLAGDGISTDKLGLLAILKKNFRVLPEQSWYPRASTLIKWFDEKNPMLQQLKTPKELLPFYLRSSEPEERLKRGQATFSRGGQAPCKAGASPLKSSLSPL